MGALETLIQTRIEILEQWMIHEYTTIFGEGFFTGIFTGLILFMLFFIVFSCRTMKKK